MADIIQKIKDSHLSGRGGASFPTYLKWKQFKQSKAKEKYIVCNGSEGEPGVLKDGYILENYLEEFISGLKLALDFFGAKKVIIYLNHNYYHRFKKDLENSIGKKLIEIFEKPDLASYVGGEETAMLNTIEGERAEPRLKPPYPGERGLSDFPTLVNNVETFYDIFLISKGRYKGNRFFTLSGDITKPGVFSFPEHYSIEKVLHEASVYPDFDFFVQVGGGANGKFFDKDDFNHEVGGAGAIVIYDKQKTKSFELIKKMSLFFKKESCGQCVVCREGAYRLSNILKEKEPNLELVSDIIFSLENSSFCALGSGLAYSIRTYFENILKIKL